MQIRITFLQQFIQGLNPHKRFSLDNTHGSNIYIKVVAGNFENFPRTLYISNQFFVHGFPRKRGPFYCRDYWKLARERAGNDVKSAKGAREENEPERTPEFSVKVLSNLPKCSIEELSQTFLSDGGFNYLPSFASLYIFLYARFSTVVGTAKKIVQT